MENKTVLQAILADSPGLEPGRGSINIALYDTEGNPVVVGGGGGGGDDRTIYGNGNPNGVVAAPIGATFRNTELGGHNGVRVWRKNSGTGTSGWVVESGDTGWRDLMGMVHLNWVPAASFPTFKIRRENSLVTLAARLQRSEDAGSSLKTSPTFLFNFDFNSGGLPEGFYPESRSAFAQAGITPVVGAGGRPAYLFSSESDNEAKYVVPSTEASNWSAGDMIAFETQWRTSSEWPQSLPGVELNPA